VNFSNPVYTLDKKAFCISLTAIFALAPILLSPGQPGKEILYPLAVVVAGGLLSSTLLDLFVTPVVFFKFGKKASEHYINIYQNRMKGDLDETL